MGVLTGTLLNAATVLIGGVVGTVVGDRLPERLRENVVRGVGLFVTAMGVKFAIDTSNLLFMLGAILLGGIIGSLVGVDARLNQLGEALQQHFARGGTSTVLKPSSRRRSFSASDRSRSSVRSRTASPGTQHS